MNESIEALMCIHVLDGQLICGHYAVEDALNLLTTGLNNRKVRATHMNIESSRSHTIFRVTIESVCCGANKTVSHSKHAVLDLVDLAGSERQAKSGVSGDGQQEAISINAGLCQLGIVIRQVCIVALVQDNCISWCV